MAKKRRHFVSLLSNSLKTVVGLVLVWRGVWYILDYLDLTVFQGDHWYTAAGGVVLGLALLYIPDRDFKEIEKL